MRWWAGSRRGNLHRVYGEVKFSAIGVMMMLTSVFAEAIRMAFYQYAGEFKLYLVEGCTSTDGRCYAVGLIVELRDFVENDGSQWRYRVT